MTPSSEDPARPAAPRLSLPPSTDLAPPHVDPRVAALAALAVVDFAKSDEGRARFAELAALGAFDLARLDDLERLADALLGVTEAFDAAPRAPHPVVVPSALDQECRARRSALVALLSEKLAEVPGVARALAQVRLSYGPVDLAVDLRVLAALVERHREALPAGANELVVSTRALARALEGMLHAHDTPELAEARAALHRLWALFDAAYVEVSSMGRELFAEGTPDAIFPTLDAIAQIQRTARHRSSSKLPAAAIVDREVPSSRRPPPMRASSRRMPAVRPVSEGEAPAKLEVVLHRASESNLWLGFSQDLAEGGVFVATYVARPLGAPVELVLHVDDRDAPIELPGVVQWIRPVSAGDDLPVGLGVRFASISRDAAKLLHAFAAKRTPIFYDD